MPTVLHLPVTVWLGAGNTRNLYTVDDLLEFLDEWPPARRGPIRDHVRRTCLAVYVGEVTQQQAREEFVAYARLMNVLEPTFDPVPGYDLSNPRIND